MDVLGRNQWGILYPSPAEIGTIADEILEKIKQLEKTGGFLFIEHEVCQKSIVMMLLLRLHGKLKRQHKQAELLLEKMAIAENFIVDSPYLIIPFPGSIPALFNAQQLEGRVMIIPYAKHDWERLHNELPDFPYEIISLKAVPETIGRSHDAQYIETMEKLYEEANPAIRQAVYYTSLVDCLSVPMTYTLLARIMGMDEDQLQDDVTSKAEGLLFLAESEMVPHLFITTAGERMANYFVSRQPQTDGLKGYLWICACAKKQDITERNLIFNTIAGLMQRGMRKVAVNMLGQCDVMKICQNSGAEEIACWGGLLQGARLLDVSAKLFQQALAKSPHSETLLLGYLRLMVDWVLVDQKKYDETIELFGRVLILYPQNPYVIQLRVSLEAGLGDFTLAQEWLGRLDSESLPGIIKTATMVSKITIEIENDINLTSDKMKILGKFSETVSTNGEKIMIQNALGKLYLANGQYQKAKDFFKKTLSLVPDNLSAQLGLATIDGERGYWQEAKKITEGIFKVDADNRQTLLFQSRMFLEQIKLAQGQDGNKVLDYYKQAQERLRHLREVDPWNIEGDIAKILLSVSMKDYDQAKEDLLTKVASRIDGHTMQQMQVYIEIMAGNFTRIDYCLKNMQNTIMDAQLLNAFMRGAYQSGNKEMAQKYFSMAKTKLHGARFVSTLNTWAELIACDTPNESLATLQQSLQLDGHNAYTLHTVGKTMLECGRDWMVEKLFDGMEKLHGLKLPYLLIPGLPIGIIGGALAGLAIGKFVGGAMAFNGKKNDEFFNKDAQEKNRVENSKVLMDKAKDMGLWL